MLISPEKGDRALWHIQKGMNSNNGANSTGKGRHKSPYLWLSINSHHSRVMGGEGASWPRQNRADGSSVYRKFSSLPATSRVTWRSAGVIRMEWMGSEARQAIGSRQLVCNNLSFAKRFAKNWGWLGVAPQVSCKIVLRISSCQQPTFQWKTYWFMPR